MERLHREAAVLRFQTALNLGLPMPEWLRLEPETRSESGIDYFAILDGVDRSVPIMLAGSSVEFGVIIKRHRKSHRLILKSFDFMEPDSILRNAISFIKRERQFLMSRN